MMQRMVANVMVRRIVLFLLSSIAAVGRESANGQEGAPATIADVTIVDWQKGPTKSQIGDIAEIAVPANFQFTGKEGTQRLLQLMENPTNGDELGMLVPNSKGADWFIVFEFDEIGYVKDDEKDKLDANAMLESIRAGTEQSNKLRKERGWSTMSIDGWEQPPKYNEQTNNLEWAIRGSSDGHSVVNYNTRVLGRRGVMKINLVCSPEELPKVMPQFRSLVAGYGYLAGSRYAEFKAGDKVAQYGLAALVTGGAAAVALKSGVLQKFWKLIVAAVVVVAGFVKRLFGGGGEKEHAS